MFARKLEGKTISDPKWIPTHCLGDRSVLVQFTPIMATTGRNNINQKLIEFFIALNFLIELSMFLIRIYLWKRLPDFDHRYNLKKLSQR